MTVSSSKVLRIGELSILSRRSYPLALALGLATLLFGMATAVRWALNFVVGNVSPFTIYFPAVLLAALIGGRRSGVAAAVLAIVVGWYLFFTTPHAFMALSATSAVNLLLFAVSISAVAAGGAYARSLLGRLDQTNQILADQVLNHNALFESMSEGFALCDAEFGADGRLKDYTIQQINPALQRMLGVGAEVIGSHLSESPGDWTAWLAACGRVLRTGQVISFERHNPGNDRWHEIHISRVTETRLAQLFFDITARKAADARQAELFDELNHRVKNNLGLTSSFLELQARGSTAEVGEQLRKAAARVRSIAEVHSALYRGARRNDVDFGAYLEDLCTSLARTLIVDERIRLEVQAHSAIVPVDTAIPLGMIVNELMTNAVKHAFAPPQDGVITIRFGHDAEGLVLSISDNGAGLPDAEAEIPDGLGMKLLKSLVAQVGGRLATDHRSGAKFDIHLPAAAARP